MPPRRRTATVPLDIELTRRKLAEGKIVRVGISRSAQFPEGAIGRVRGIGDPAVDGEEYVQVELTLGGTRDVLPFTPADLTPATRGRPPAAPAPPAAQATPAAGDVRVIGSDISAVNGSAVGARRGRRSPPIPPPPGPEMALSDAPSAALFGAASVDSPTGPAAGSVAEPVGAPARPAARAPRAAKRPPAVTITIATTDTEPTTWRIEAKVGARVALRAGAVTPARVWEMVQSLQNETLSRAVGVILTEQRTAAEARAEALAAELAAVRAELDALPSAGNP